MNNNWEETFARWSKPPSESEEERCSNTISMIKSALNNHTDLKDRKTPIIIQGSFRNNTNIRRDSDIDVCIILMDVFFGNYPEGYKKEDYGIGSSQYAYSQFKNSVEEALRQKFGSSNVHRGNKAFSIDSNSYRVKGDILPALEYRRYTKPPNQSNNYLSGVKFITDNGNEIINWPEQHYTNGVDKNTKTSQSFKRTVRIFKNLRNDMTGNNIHSAKNFPSFLIECLCWNVPNNKYSSSNYTNIVKSTLVYLHKNTKTFDTCQEWEEVSELKYLFRNSQLWTYQQVNTFVLDAWKYLEF